MTESTDCPICDGALRPSGVEARDHLVTGDGPFRIAECPACELGVTVPQLSEDALDRYYDASYYEGFYEHSGGTAGGVLHQLRDLIRRRAARRRHSRPPLTLDGLRPGRALEVGCGAGNLLAHLRGLGWDTYGIDPSPAATAAAARASAVVHTGTLANQPWKGARFDLIVFQHSLEHIPDPVGALREARTLLAPGGRLIIDVPNWSSWQRRLFGGRWAMLDLPRHLQHFSPRALTRLAGRLDLNLRLIGTCSNAIATAYSVHYLIAGRWTPGWKLWLSYAVSLPLLPFILLGDRLGGGDACYAVMQRPA